MINTYNFISCSQVWSMNKTGEDYIMNNLIQHSQTTLQAITWLGLTYNGIKKDKKRKKNCTKLIHVVKSMTITRKQPKK